MWGLCRGIESDGEIGNQTGLVALKGLDLKRKGAKGAKRKAEVVGTAHSTGSDVDASCRSPLGCGVLRLARGL